MRTYKNRHLQTKRRKTIKGGIGPNEKAFVVVSKSRLDPNNENLLYKLIITRPTFPFLDYLNYNMNLVDEALAEIKIKDDSTNPKEKNNIVYIDKLEYGNNQTVNTKLRLNEKNQKNKEKGNAVEIKENT